jgi:DNA-binding NtrC family response regulator
MAARKMKVLLCDDDTGVQFFMGELLRKESLQFDIAQNGKEAIEMLEKETYSLVLLDERMPGMSGIEALRKIKSMGFRMPVIMITAYGTKGLAMQAIREGAYDFFTKPVDIEVVRTVIKRALEKFSLEEELEELRAKTLEDALTDEIIAESPSMKNAVALAKKVAQTDVTVLITGESGSGKELIAKSIHRLSDRKEGPFVSVNCAAIPEGLLESELFGYEKGAFTGAHKRHTGKFERAEGGTIFLDEIGDLTLGLQAKLLRVLQEKEIERLGGASPIKVDIRVVSATNKDIRLLAKEGSFREDLLYRVGVFEIDVPPLRERREDIPLLLGKFLKLYSKEIGKPVSAISGKAMGMFVSHPWPGNVRQLQNLLQRAIIMEEGGIIGEDTAAALLGGETHMESRHGAPKEQIRIAKEDEEKRLIADALTKTRWRRQEAAEILGMSRKSLFLKMKRYGIG